MSYKNSLLLFAVFMATGFGGYLAIDNGFYPAAIVNFDVITAGKLNRTYFAVYRYLQNAALASGKNIEQLEEEGARQEIRRAAIDKLIADLLIYQELERRLPADFRGIAEKNIGEFIKNNADLEQGTKLLYGMELAEFKEQILLPQAYREILEGRMFLSDENFEEWFRQARNSATVLILSPKLEWREGEVKIKD